MSVAAAAAAVSAASSVVSKSKRVLHVIRHAESQLNVACAHANAGYFEGITYLDSKLSDHGFEQCENLRHKIEKEDSNNPYLLKQAQLVITSPLSRSILTALNSMPIDKYNYKVKAEIAEQVENTSDIGYHKSDLSQMYPQLSNQFSELADAWWWQHPYRRSNVSTSNSNNNNNNNNNVISNGMSKANNNGVKYSAYGNSHETHSIIEQQSHRHFSTLALSDESGKEKGNGKEERNVSHCPELDAQILIEHRGKSPASEPKYNLRMRSLKFIKWLYSDGMINDMNWDNIAAFSHACTIRELEMLLLTINNQMNDKEAIEWQKDDTIRSNTEQITFDLPLSSNDIDWKLLEYRVEQAKNVKNHADLE